MCSNTNIYTQTATLRYHFYSQHFNLIEFFSSAITHRIHLDQIWWGTVWQSTQCDTIIGFRRSPCFSALGCMSAAHDCDFCHSVPSLCPASTPYRTGLRFMLRYSPYPLCPVLISFSVTSTFGLSLLHLTQRWQSTITEPAAHASTVPTPKMTKPMATKNR